jgi:hypothetical protein
MPLHCEASFIQNTAHMSNEQATFESHNEILLQDSLFQFPSYVTTFPILCRTSGSIIMNSELR